jgi:hypothetical protein
MSVLGVKIEFPKLVSFIEKNPNKTKKLIEITQNNEISQNLNLPGGNDKWGYYIVEPAEPLSTYMYLTDNMYSVAPELLRANLLLEVRNKLSGQIDALKDGKIGRMRRKALEWLSKHHSLLTDEERKQYWSILCVIGNIQTIIVGDGKNPTITFSPDIRRWTDAYPTYIVSEDLTRVWKPYENINSKLVMWLDNMESTGSIIDWPEAEGTKTELIEICETFPNWKIEHEKKKKEELARMVSRRNAINYMMSWK